MCIGIKVHGPILAWLWERHRDLEFCPEPREFHREDGDAKNSLSSRHRILPNASCLPWLCFQLPVSSIPTDLRSIDPVLTPHYKPFPLQTTAYVLQPTMIIIHYSPVHILKCQSPTPGWTATWVGSNIPLQCQGLQADWPPSKVMRTQFRRARPSLVSYHPTLLQDHSMLFPLLSHPTFLSPSITLVFLLHLRKLRSLG